MNLRAPGSVLLISCYELGHQPLGAASPLGFLKRAGFAPAALDIAVDGRPAGEIPAGESIGARFERDLGTIVQLPGSSFYRRLREKFGRLAS